MKVKYIGESEPLVLVHGKVYDVISVESDFYRIIDESGEDYLYSKTGFQVVQE